MKKIFFQIAIFFFFLSSNISYSSDKIYFIDLDFVLKNSIIGKNTLKNIEDLNNKNIQELKKKEVLLKKLEKDIKSKKNVISEEKFNKELIILRKKINKYKELKDQLVINFGKEKNNSIQNFFEKINPIIRDYMSKNSIDILLQNKNVFIGKSNLDITGEIIKEININLK